MTTAARQEPLTPVPAAADRPGPRSTAGLPAVDNPGALPPKDARALTGIFFARLDELEEGTWEYQYVRNTLIEMNQSLVQFAARPFRHRGGDDAEDVFQVGMVGLIKAVDRFDPSREVMFPTFALPYIRGEIKRHLRDATWAVHVPRRMQELRVELAKAKEDLENDLGAAPSVSQLARRMGLEESEVVQATTAANGYSTASLDAVFDGGTTGGSRSGHRSPAETLGALDPAVELFENCHSLAPALRELTERELCLLRLRFGEERTQQQIGDELGCSQMHVSRQLSRIYLKLRTSLLADPA
ncbi:SigB/SigF/SigG family RNA polymerase sigma factor [Actinacidiphila reveromycinica]|nr:SigB/SigF/SigG family RNA polymerase sigma factor [Streptomyces sp. SN-593]